MCLQDTEVHMRAKAIQDGLIRLVEVRQALLSVSGDGGKNENPIRIRVYLRA